MRFSIIATHYDKSVSDEELQRFINSLADQTINDFEIIILHDGPRNRESNIDTKGLNIQFIDTDFRGNCWGHNLRTLGMRIALGEYFIHTNTDNVYYPTALEYLANSIANNNFKRKVFIGSVVMRGLNKVNTPEGYRIYYDTPRDYSKFYVLTGNPVVFGNIDMMNLIAHRSVWEEINYWYDLRPASDALIYEDICRKYIPVYVNTTLGEHY